MKLGQVGPILFLLFAIGWRWLDDPRAVGGSAAAGAIVKIQPGLVLVWAALTRRWSAVVVGIAVLVLAAIAATLVTGGPSVWTDYVALLRNVSDPIATPHNFTPGAVAYQAGVPTGLAETIQLASSVAAIAVVVIAALRASTPASYLASSGCRVPGRKAIPGEVVGPRYPDGRVTSQRPTTRARVTSVSAASGRLRCRSPR